jgi:hypothetical protein
LHAIGKKREGFVALKFSNGNGSEPVRYCWCDELIVNGKRIPMPKFHDCEYVRRRSELVKTAMATVTKNIPFIPFQNGERFTRAFVSEMEKLSAPLLR